MVYILKNPKSGGRVNAPDLDEHIHSEGTLAGKTFTDRDITGIGDMVDFLKGLAPEDEVVIVGGDGTLNHLANDIRGYKPKNPLYLYACGTGNDFINDIVKKEEKDQKLFRLNDYIVDLPVVVIDGKAYSFLNNVAYGIDGEVCVVADDMKAKGAKKVNYTTIAVRLLMKYKVCDVHVAVDGKAYDFEKTWLAPVMNGRFYGGGMMVAPNQDRNSGEISTVMFCNSGRLKTLMLFPKIFSGAHVRYKKHFVMMSGKDIEVTMAVPKHVQIDGEVIRDVRTMHAYKGEAARAYDLYTEEGELKK